MPAHVPVLGPFAGLIVVLLRRRVRPNVARLNNKKAAVSTPKPVTAVARVQPSSCGSRSESIVPRMIR